MSDINLATASKAEMKKYAIAELDLSLTMNYSEDTMRTKIMARCEELGVTPPMAEIHVKKTSGKQKKFVINIPKAAGPSGAEPAFVGIQGVGYYIPRGINVVVPESVVGVLKTAIQTVYEQDPDTAEMIGEDVPTYPFQIVSEAA